MLRGLVLLFLLLNVALFFWIRSDPPQLRPDREPQRLDRQISPDAIQVLPDLPTSSGTGHGADASASSSLPDDAASAPSSGGTAASGAASAGSSVKVSEADVDCAESGPLNENEVATLRKSLAKAGVPPEAIVERKQPSAGTWLVYMGRFADAQAWQAKADELKRMNIPFVRVTQPPSLNPGLSLGSYASAADANTHLEELGKHGVKTAHVVAGSASGVSRLQVRSTSSGWRLGTGTQRFGACTTPA